MYFGYEPVLYDEKEILNFIVSIASEQVDEELILEYFVGCKAVLEEVLVANLQEGNLNSNIRSKSRERKYGRLPSRTMPPLVVEDGCVVDGNHRLRVLKTKKIKKARIYIIER